jgi:beta-glucosidase
MRYLSLSLFTALLVTSISIACKPKRPSVAFTDNLPASPAPAVVSERDRFLDSLLSIMTLEEKVGQLNLPSIGFDVTGPLLSTDVEGKIKRGQVGGVFNTFTPVAVRKLQDIAVKETRLGIPLLFGYDVIHGHRTIYPIPLGMAASWNMQLIEQIARASAREASADGINWVFSPMVDIARDPRWGRVSEGAGEDPYLGSRIAAAMVCGYQGDNFNDATHVMACIKHFALYGAGEAGRDYNTVDMSKLRMYNEFLPPYKAGIDAGVATVMTSFNEVDGIPASANHWLMTELLRNEWGFKGMVASDYTAINEMVNHGVGDEREVARLGIEAAVEMDMVGELYLKHLPQLVKDGVVADSTLNKACRLVLAAKYDLGLFSNPYKFVNEERAKTEMMSKDHLTLSKQAAMESMVLLKNNNNTLPLKSSQKIAFIGPFVKDKRNLIGNWSGAGDWQKAASLWEGLEAKYGANKFLYAKGCNIMDDENLRQQLNAHDGRIEMDTKSPKQLLDEAVSTAKKSDVVVVFLGETFGMSGEAACRTNIQLLSNQRELLKALKGTGKPIVLLLTNGRPLDLSWEDENMDAILETWFAGTMAGHAMVDVLFGDYNPSGKLAMTFPRNIGQVPIYYNAKNTGRPFDANQKYTSKYLDSPNTPLYPFGYGLSYSEITYSNVQLDNSSMGADDVIKASVTVTNGGKLAAQETVQLYIRDLIGSITRPVKELKGFEKVFLNPGESKEVTFEIREKDLRFYNSKLKFVSEAGEFEIMIGRNSNDVQSQKLMLNK